MTPPGGEETRRLATQLRPMVGAKPSSKCREMSHHMLMRKGLRNQKGQSARTRSPVRQQKVGQLQYSAPPKGPKDWGNNTGR